VYRKLDSAILVRSVFDLQIAINRFVAETNDDPKPFTWTADPNKINAAVRRGYQGSQVGRQFCSGRPFHAERPRPSHLQLTKCRVADRTSAVRHFKLASGWVPFASVLPRVIGVIGFINKNPAD
jgi:hypothetical protein